VEENTNIDVIEEIGENYLRSFEYTKHKWMCWMKYHNPTHIKGIQSWIE
jgi:hypothetical protein